MQVSDNIADSCLYDLSGGLWGPSVQGEEVVKGLLVWAHFGGHAACLGRPPVEG